VGRGLAVFACFLACFRDMKLILAVFGLVFLREGPFSGIVRKISCRDPSFGGTKDLQAHINGRDRPILGSRLLAGP
jgi:hypothetical protein